jgi:hypothetical protein
VFHDIVGGQVSTDTVVTFSPSPLLSNTATGTIPFYYTQGTVIADTLVGTGNIARLLSLGAIQ